MLTLCNSAPLWWSPIPLHFSYLCLVPFEIHLHWWLQGHGNPQFGEAVRPFLLKIVKWGCIAASYESWLNLDKLSLIQEVATVFWDLVKSGPGCCCLSPQKICLFMPHLLHWLFVLLVKYVVCQQCGLLQTKHKGSQRCLWWEKSEDDTPRIKHPPALTVQESCLATTNPFRKQKHLQV